MENYIPIQKFDKFDCKVTNLIKSFQTKFNNSLVKFIVKVPGRVNLVGEHVDYSGFPVISMAIEQSVMIAVSLEKISQSSKKDFKNGEINFNQINLSNTNQDLYQDYLFNTTDSLTNLTKPKWYHYVICGYKGVLEKAAKKQANLSKIFNETLSFYDINMMTTGDIPHSAGLSSSSALVVASSIVFRYCLDLVLDNYFKSKNISNDENEFFKINKHEMASDCAYFERYIGTQGGGIDQAIQLLAESGTAKLIKFKPKLDASNVELPRDCEFFVLHCGKTLNKASTIDFNVRVFETRVAALLLKKHLLKDQESKNEKTLLSDFETKDEENPYYDLIRETENLFKESKGRFTISEIQKLLKVDTLENLSEKTHFPLKSLNLIVESNNEEFKFNLLKRAMHVYKEVNRVLKMQSIDSNLDNDSKLNLIGELLNESHRSLKELYECSCEELDKLVELSNFYGAKGAKLTGAGWSGCLVAIVPKDKVKEYEKKILSHCKFMIKTKPNQSATIYTIN